MATVPGYPFQAGTTERKQAIKVFAAASLLDQMIAAYQFHSNTVVSHAEINAAAANYSNDTDFLLANTHPVYTGSELFDHKSVAATCVSVLEWREHATALYDMIMGSTPADVNYSEFSNFANELMTLALKHDASSQYGATTGNLYRAALSTVTLFGQLTVSKSMASLVCRLLLKY